MSFWIILWKATFIIGLLLFVGMAGWIIVGGFQDIKILFRRLKDRSDE
jgi:hypothetical protein